jgi:metal-responsive CopG/Arc/MetJ family transcriptional regulator
VKKKISVEVDEQLVSELDVMCFQENKTRSQLIREIITNFLGCLNK